MRVGGGEGLEGWMQVVRLSGETTLFKTENTSSEVNNEVAMKS